MSDLRGSEVDGLASGIKDPDKEGVRVDDPQISIDEVVAAEWDAPYFIDPATGDPLRIPSADEVERAIQAALERVHTISSLDDEIIKQLSADMAPLRALLRFLRVMPELLHHYAGILSILELEDGFYDEEEPEESEAP